MSKDKSVANDAVTAALDDYLLKALEELWSVVKDPKHPEHKRHYFESLKLILRHTAPIRKESQPVQENNDISVQIANLFHGNSIDHKQPLEIETGQEMIDVDQDISSFKTET